MPLVVPGMSPDPATSNCFASGCMTSEWSLGGASLLLAGGAAWLVHQAGQPGAPLLHHLDSFEKRLQRSLTFARWTVSARAVLSWQTGALVLALALLFVEPLASLLLGLVVLYLPLRLAAATRRKVALIDGQVHSFLESLSRALEASPSLGEALAATRDATPEPLRHELDQTLNELQLGLPLGSALTHLERRVGSDVLALALSTLQVGRQTGGALPQVLKEAAGTLREMERLAGVIRTKTAEGKMQSLVIGGLPVPLFFAMNFTDPHHFDPLRHTPLGHLLVAVAAVLWIAALFAAKKILAVRI